MDAVLPNECLNVIWFWISVNNEDTDKGAAVREPYFYVFAIHLWKRNSLHTNRMYMASIFREQSEPINLNKDNKNHNMAFNVIDQLYHWNP